MCALFDRAQVQSARTGAPEAYLAFRASIEDVLGRSNNVRDYGRDIGFSERTISRDCRCVTGLTAKGVLANGRVLEAARLLAHTARPGTSIAAELRFTEATNFHKFVLRHANQRPLEFREANRLVA